MIVLEVYFFILVLLVLSAYVASRKVLYFWLLVFVFYAALRDGGSVNDYLNYQLMYENDVYDLEYSFKLVCVFVKLVFNNSFYLFLLYALIAVVVKFVAIKQLTPLLYLSLLLYFSDFYILQELTQMRAGVATSFLLLCIRPLYERKGGLFVLYAFMAIFFHLSAIVILPLWFLDGKKINPARYIVFLFFAYFIAICKLDIVSFVSYIPVSGIQDKFALYSAVKELDGDYSANVFSLLFLGKMFIAIILLWKIEYISRCNKYAVLLLKIMFLSLFSLLLLSTNTAFALRTSELFGVVSLVLFPMIYYVVYPKEFAIFIVVVISLFLSYVRIVAFGLIQ